MFDSILTPHLYGDTIVEPDDDEDPGAARATAVEADWHTATWLGDVPVGVAGGDSGFQTREELLRVTEEQFHATIALSALEALQSVERSAMDAEVSELDADLTLVRLAQGIQREVHAGAERIALAAHWADLHAVLERPASTRGSEQLVRLGGVGTPAVAEFAPAELGAVLGISSNAAADLVADALDLRHRLPMLWTELQSGAVKPWVARKVASATRRLPPPSAAMVDRRIARSASTLPFGRLMKVVDAAILAADPPAAVSGAERAAMECRVVRSLESDHGYGTLFVKAAAGDLDAFDRALDTVSRALKVLGDTRPADQRRSTAVGVLADPQAALDLVAEADAVRRSGSKAAHQTEGVTGAGHSAGPEPQRLAERCDTTFGNATLFVHVTSDQVAAVAGTSGASDGSDVATAPGAAVVRMESVGPVLLDQVRDWLGHRKVTLRPVLDLPGVPAVDRYEVTPSLAEAARQRTPASCWPHSSNVSRSGDLDHTAPYVPPARGGRGQTRLDNLGRLSRVEHRVKTFGRWRVTQPRSGAWLWRSPHGHCYLVDEAGTTALGTLT